MVRLSDLIHLRRVRYNGGMLNVMSKISTWFLKPPRVIPFGHYVQQRGGFFFIFNRRQCDGNKD